MSKPTVFWTLAFLTLNILKCKSISIENVAKSNIQMKETEDFNKIAMKSKTWINSETQNLKFSPELDHKKSQMDLKNLNFTENVEKCIKNYQYEITLNFKTGKSIILKCVKDAININLVKYLMMPKNFSFSFFKGMFEFTKISDSLCNSTENFEASNCNADFEKNVDNPEKEKWLSKARKYVKIYSSKDNTEKLEEKKLKNVPSDEEQLERIEMQQNNLYFEVVKSFDDDVWEKKEMEELKKELNDSKLLDTINAFTSNYELKIKYFEGATGKIRRGKNNRIIFDIDIGEHLKKDEEFENEVQENWRQSRLDFSSESEESLSQSSQEPEKKKKRKNKNNEKRKETRKQQKEKRKGIKKHLSFLIFPVMIQLALLPFVLKKLFFLAIGALLAGKLAIILVVYRLLRNMKVNDENHYLRLEHYGYKEGEEYGSWMNGRSFSSSLIDSLSDAPFNGRNLMKSR